MIRELARVLAALAIGGSALLAYTAYRINDQGSKDEQRPADAVVVLGAAQFNGVAGGVFAARLDHAVELVKAGIAPYLIVTGGKQPGDRTTEAATARAYARARGIPADQILMENTGRSTLESLQNVALVMKAHNLHSAVFVSDRTHMLRVLRMATDLGIQGWGSPTTTSPTDLEPDRRSRAILHEMAGLLAYSFGVGGQVDESAISGTP
ncbi:MAG TPA: YdcF family protein [Candidatus Limnocylindrales bacterium]